MIDNDTFKPKPIVNGLWQIADMERNGAQLDQSDIKTSIEQYIDNGLTHFDMADHYGSAEVIMGEYQKQSSNPDLKLFTKWVPKPGKLTEQEIREAVQRSLDRLQTEQIELLQYHAWNYADPSWLDQLFALTKMREEGYIKQLGLTNTDAAHLKLALDSGIPIVSNQISFSLLDRRAQKYMTSVCSMYGVKILAFGTLAGGFLSERWLDKEEPKLDALATWSQMKYKRYIDEIGGWKSFQQSLQKLKSLADQHEVTIANLATAFVLNHHAVGSVIIGGRLGHSAHIENNLHILQMNYTDELHE